EIHEQPEAIAATLADRTRDGFVALDELDLDEEDLRTIDKVVIVGCGSSYHAGLVGKFAIEAWGKLPTEVDIASEFRYRDAIFDASTLVVGVSQSGETIDTLEAIKKAKKSGSKVIAVSNIVGASMTREADGTIYTRAGLEVSVASTKTVLAQVVALELLALRLAELRGTRSAEEIAEAMANLQALPAALSTLVDSSAGPEAIADAVGDAQDFFFLGRHLGFPVALEGALKLKEISYLRAEGYPAGELKHGPIALIEPGVVVVAIVLSGPMAEKMYSNIAEVKARGATVICVAGESDHIVDSLADYVLRIPDVAELVAPVLAMVPLQQLAYAIAQAKGFDVDRPRNLAKTVTVE
ncbi:MAG: glutamine--fructose-6-phosphate transaminase (isomerizing), partial [Actinomycetota bacterium]